MENKAKEVKKTAKKARADKYEDKVKFDGSLEDMIKIAVKPIHNKVNKSES